MTEREATRRPHLRRIDPQRDDFEALLALVHDAFAHMKGVVDPPSSAFRLTAQALREKAAAQTGLAFFDGETPVACLFCDERADALYLGKLAVAPGWQGRGLGRALVEEAVRLARSAGKRALELQTRVELARNHAFFAALGFVMTGEGAHEGYDRPTWIVMRRAVWPAGASLKLTAQQEAIAAGAKGEGAAMAMRLVADSARLLGARSLVQIASAHIDGALYHGDSGTLFAERLVERGARAAVRATLNVGALDLTGCSSNRLGEHERAMARRMARAYMTMGCEPSWTCAPYQAGHRPQFGTDVAWGESNAVVFANSVLGARTNRYGDYLDIACAIAGYAPLYGLHEPENRLARFVFDVSGLPRRMFAEDSFWPVLGSLYGRRAGDAVGLVTGVPVHPGEDALKAFGAAAASTGGVGLFHMAGVTPEALAGNVLAPEGAEECFAIGPDDIREQKARLATVAGAERIDAVAIGSPHLSNAQFERLAGLLAGRRASVPFYACTGRHVLRQLEAGGLRAVLEACGVTLVVDTCVVVAPVMESLPDGVLMTDSGKFAQYAPGNTGYGVLFGSLAECVESAVAGRPVHEP